MSTEKKKLHLSEIPGSLLNDGITEVEVAAPVTGTDVADAEGLWPEWKAIILASTKRGSLQEQSVPLSLVYDFADFVASRRAALIRTALEEQTQEAFRRGR
jgi:hypothetical protein